MQTTAVIIMGVSGSGKTTLGQALAEQLGWAFADADDYHPAANREKMARGEALTDADRQPWLERLHQLLTEYIAAERPLVLACSALRQHYRDTLQGNLVGIALVFARGSRELIAERMQGRQHFMPVSLLESQFATLEPPTGAIEADIRQPISELVAQIVAQL